MLTWHTFVWWEMNEKKIIENFIYEWFDIGMFFKNKFLTSAYVLIPKAKMYEFSVGN